MGPGSVAPSTRTILQLSCRQTPPLPDLLTEDIIPLRSRRQRGDWVPSHSRKGKSMVFRKRFVAPLLACFLAACLAVFAQGYGVSIKLAKAPAPDTVLEDALKKARVDGKYGMLLRQIKVEKDKESY